MGTYTFTSSPFFEKLRTHALKMNHAENHLKHLLKHTSRHSEYTRQGGGLLYDYSHQRVDATAMDLLFSLARNAGLNKKFEDMISGKTVNPTEGRAALHTAARCTSNQQVFVDKKDIMPEMLRVRKEIKTFCGDIENHRIMGSTGKPFSRIVVVGIGGSYLGTEFISTALTAYADKGMAIEFLANVDIHNFGRIQSKADPECTLWIIISKSYTTAETLANENLVREYLSSAGIDASRHIVTVTAKGSPGDDPSNPVLRSFHMFDFIGGRYSVTSAVGGVPLSLYLGYERFEALLKGAEQMDNHAQTAPADRNLPMIAALISVWNTSFLKYGQQAIIPYATPLSRLAPHIQQLNMESNGKSVTAHGSVLEEPAGTVIFGEPGTCAQHSFFQLAHQGNPFPIEFIGVIRPQYDQFNSRSKGVTNHQELWANMLAQANALAIGKESNDSARRFTGNRPSSTITLEDLSPENIGRLLSFYEAKTVFEAFIWGINPFDQFGVELGKIMASDIREEMTARNMKPGYMFHRLDASTNMYLDALFAGKLPNHLRLGKPVY